jgi:hypothetical protein
MLKDISCILANRFGPVPFELANQLASVNGTQSLRDLLKWAVIWPALAAFAARLAK